MKSHLIYLPSLCLMLSGCQFLEKFEKPEGVAVKVVDSHGEEYAKYTKKAPKPAPTPKVAKQEKPTTKRINTTACQDSDDWYLDGYRVGKSFSAQKQQMLQQRLNYCHYSSSNVPTQFKTNWQRGFNVGRKSAK